MRLKSYFAESVEAAMGLAARELGDNAVLVYSREAEAEARHLGKHEAVVALDDEAPPQETHPGLERISRRLEEVCAQMEQLSRRLRRPPPEPPAVPDPSLAVLLESPVCGRWTRRLLEQGVPADMLIELLTPLERQSMSPLAARNDLARRLAEPVKFLSRLGVLEGGKRVVALTGPAGAGKTTGVIRMAAQFVLRTGRIPQLVAYDPSLDGGFGRLGHYGGILGAPLTLVSSPAELKEAIRRASNADLVLVDTPGLGWGDPEEGKDLAALLCSLDDVEVHLVLPASCEPGALDRLAARYDIFRPACVQFTRLDEAWKCGPLWAYAARSGKPLSFYSKGPAIPEDLEPASAALFAARLLGPCAASPESGAERRWQSWTPPAARPEEPVVPFGRPAEAAPAAPPQPPPAHWFTGTFGGSVWPPAAAGRA